MTSRHGRKCVKSEVLNLQCEWINCRQIFDDLSDFYTHLHEHYQISCTSETSFHNKDGTLSCQWNDCVFVTRCHNDLLRHLYFHGYHTKVKWWGLLCYKKENLNECRTLHNRNIVPELPEGFRCEWTECYMLFDIPDQFYMHVYNHALFAEGEQIKAEQCSFKCHWEGCSYSYVAKGSAKAKVGKFKLREHLRSHTKERCYACPWCGNLYVNRTKFTDHLNRQMNIESHCFQCTHCSRTFATERLLKDHMRHHVNYYKCPKCAMTCPNPSGLKHHMKYKHSDERPFACQFCEYKSKTSYDLQVHLTFHQSDLSYRCHVKGCDYAVRSLQSLRYHFRTKHMVGKGKCYACHLCTKTYGVGFQLTNHLRTAHGFQWPPGHSRFKYKECDDGFFRLQTFRFESVELTEELMVDDQSTSNKMESTSCNIKTQAVKSKVFKLKKKRLGTKHQQQLPSMTTRSATMLLQKAQSQRLKKSNPRLRGNMKKISKKRTALRSHALSAHSSILQTVDSENNPIDLSKGKDGNSSSNAVADYPQAPQLCDDMLMIEFGGKQGLPSQASKSNTVEVVESLPSTDTIATTSSSLQIASEISTQDLPSPSNQAGNSGAAYTSLPNASSVVPICHSKIMAASEGSWVSDENGAIKSLLIDGVKYYLLKCIDATNTATYSLVSATGRDEPQSVGN